ncbi:MAG: hypothetical protein WCH62_02830 [Candidatus Omnitrophota bacterium]
MNKRGQSIIEYSLLAILIIVGIIYMGPYVIRSINAHFKLWQESIDDTTNDRMLDVPTNVIAPTCSCGAKTFAGCGSQWQRANQNCAPDEHYWYTPCTPSTCGYGLAGGFDEGCSPDSDPAVISSGQPPCCDIYTASNPKVCGSVHLPYVGFSRTPPNANGSVEVSPHNVNDDSTYCYYGEQVMYKQCTSTDANRIHCKPNPACNPTCEGNLPTDNSGNPVASPCSGATTGLTHDWPVVITQTCPSSSPKCYYSCKPGYVPQTGVTGVITCAPCSIISCTPTSVTPGGSLTGGKTWGNFLRNYAMWIAPAGDDHVLGDLPATFTRNISIPATDVYTIRFAVDDRGSVDIDGKTICSSFGNFSPNLYTDCSASLTKGDHTIILSVTNLSADGITWAKNSAAVAIQIGNKSGAAFTALSPAIDTSTSQLSEWATSLQCFNGESWDCSNPSSAGCSNSPPTAMSCSERFTVAPVAVNCSAAAIPSGCSCTSSGSNPTITTLTCSFISCNNVRISSASITGPNCASGCTVADCTTNDGTPGITPCFVTVQY